MAGLAAMTVVVEGTVSSGSLITAGFAQDLGREVGAVPGQVTSALAAGPERAAGRGRLGRALGGGRARRAVRAGRAARASRIEPPPRWSHGSRALLEAVERGEGSPDTLASGAEEAAEVLAGLTELELLGLVRRRGRRRATSGRPEHASYALICADAPPTAYRASCRSPARTRAAAPGSRPT